jgi:cyclopropane fatty-acyl-phospholipid synthase-like methyltransferase
MTIENRYLNGPYLLQNPNWHKEDAAWKANQVVKILKDFQIQPTSIAEVGCGSGEVLLSLIPHFPHTELLGYDISPQAAQFWPASTDEVKVKFKLGNFHQLNHSQFDIVMMLDVFEHVRDPFTFLEETHSHGTKFIFHIPLDLSVISIARKMTLLNSRSEVGHLHFYTKDLALEMLKDCGYKIIEWRYTGASLNMKESSLKTRLARLPRQLTSMVDKDWAVRLLGGETLLVLAE